MDCHVEILSFSITFAFALYSCFNHFGEILTKEADIEAHRSEVLNFTHIQVIDQRARLLDRSAITVTRVSLKGTLGADSIEDEMGYARVWQNIGGKMKIISGHCSSAM
ncbi:nuclear transport factor 2 family protein [Domibacillus tundrae]|uniref:nuclear transport factor 2 family protein n=1 Tax=Domibacillus tundrae TaxID=1587527 RepID=UPI0033924B10